MKQFAPVIERLRELQLSARLESITTAADIDWPGIANFASINAAAASSPSMRAAMDQVASTLEEE